jgi:hypothetical protein
LPDTKHTSSVNTLHYCIYCSNITKKTNRNRSTSCKQREIKIFLAFIFSFLDTVRKICDERVRVRMKSQAEGYALHSVTSKQGNFVIRIFVKRELTLRSFSFYVFCCNSDLLCVPFMWRQCKYEWRSEQSWPALRYRLRSCLVVLRTTTEALISVERAVLRTEIHALSVPYAKQYCWIVTDPSSSLSRASSLNLSQ